MNTTFSVLLSLSFVVSLIALAAMVWAITQGRFFGGKQAAVSVLENAELDTELDTQNASLVIFFLSVALIFLVVGSFYGLAASLKLHWPDWLSSQAWLTFGRARTVHLNLVNYGWLSVASLGVIVWVLPRIFKTPLRRPSLAWWGGIFWAVGLTAGVIAISFGWNDGVEWLEIPWQLSVFLVVGVLCLSWVAVETAIHKKVGHIYVSAWYYLAALLWFPALYFIAKLPGLHFGVEQAKMNWWFAHNVLGLWVTPMGIATAYYLLPKIIGKPIYSYNLSLLGFWSLALFYSQVGIHHLVGGPIPTWLVTLSIVHSIMMFVPVIAVAINQHGLVLANLGALKNNYTLKFVWLGALMYTLSSMQGSLEALRSINSITHFTHFTVAHAHLGAYGFISLIMMGAIYYLMPQLLKREWPKPKLIKVHFWLVVSGITIYVVFLSIGGWLQGLGLLDVSTTFAQVTQQVKPYLMWRSVGGSLMTLGHLVFAYHFAVFLCGCKNKKLGGAV